VTFPGAYTLILSFILGWRPVCRHLGARSAGSEWTWGTLKSAVARGESRSRISSCHSPRSRHVGLGLRLALAPRGGRRRRATLAVYHGRPRRRRTLRTIPSCSAAAGLAIVRRGPSLCHRHPGSQPARRDRDRDRVYFGEQFAAIFLPDIVSTCPSTLPVPWWRRREAAEASAVAARRSRDSSQMWRCSWVAVWLAGALIVSALLRSEPRSPADASARSSLDGVEPLGRRACVGRASRA